MKYFRLPTAVYPYVLAFCPLLILAFSVAFFIVAVHLGWYEPDFGCPYDWELGAYDPCRDYVPPVSTLFGRLAVWFMWISFAIGSGYFYPVWFLKVGLVPKAILSVFWCALVGHLLGLVTAMWKRRRNAGSTHAF